MDLKTKLLMTFKDSVGKRVSLAVDGPKEDLTEEDIYDAMSLINVVIDLCRFFGVSCNYLLGISTVREHGSIGNTYDQFIALAALIIESDGYDDDFKRDFFMGIKNKFGC